MTRNNTDIRTYAKEKRVPLWKIAECIGLKDYQLSRKLRNELPKIEKNEIIRIIDNYGYGGTEKIDRSKKGYYQRIVDEKTLTTYYEIYDKDGNHVASCVCEEEFQEV